MSIAPAFQTAPGQESPSTAQGNVAQPPRKSTNYVVDNEENLVKLNAQGFTGISVPTGFEPKMHVAGPRRVFRQVDPRKRRMVSMNFATEIGFDRYPWQPPCGMRSSPPFMANAVTATTGMALSSGSSLSHLVTSRPEISGS